MNPLISLTVFKIFISIFIVFVLAEISKRANPQIAGMVSGLPLGTGLSIYFISMEQGIDFTLSGIPWGIAGLAASLVFCLVYLLISRSIAMNSKLVEIFLSSAAGMMAFVMIGSLIFLMEMNIALASFIFIFVFIINLVLMNKLIGKQEKGKGAKSTGIHYFIRGMTVGIIIVFITGAAALVGSKWANIFSSFPSMLFPLIVVLHYEDDHRLFPYVIYGFSYSIATLFVFYMAYVYLVPIYGLNIGYFFIYAICAAFLYWFQKIRAGLGLVR